MNSHRFGTALVLSCLLVVPAGSALAYSSADTGVSKTRMLGTTILAQTTPATDAECDPATATCESGEQKSSGGTGGSTNPDSQTDDSGGDAEGGGDVGGDNAGGGDGTNDDSGGSSEGGGDVGGGSGGGGGNSGGGNGGGGNSGGGNGGGGGGG